MPDLRYISKNMLGVTLNSQISLELFNKATTKTKQKKRVHSISKNGVERGFKLSAQMNSNACILKRMENMRLLQSYKHPLKTQIQSIEHKGLTLDYMMKKVYFWKL